MRSWLGDGLGERTVGSFAAVGKTYIYLHLLIQLIVHDEAVSHSYSVRLHRMSGDVGIIAHI